MIPADDVLCYVTPIAEGTEYGAVRLVVAGTMAVELACSAVSNDVLFALHTYRRGLKSCPHVEDSIMHASVEAVDGSATSAQLGSHIQHEKLSQKHMSCGHGL